MQRLKYLLMLVAGVLLIACADRGEDTPAGGGNNNGGNDTPEKPDTETPINVEELPEGVDIGAGTFQLNNIQLEHIEGVDEDNSTLTFSSDLPAEQIPQKGQIILQYSATDALPYGFLGRVTNVTTVGNNIVVETEAPALNEAFDKLIFNEELQIVDNTPRSSLVNIGKDDEGYNYVGFDLTGEVELNKYVKVSIGGSLTFFSKLQNSSYLDNSIGADDMNMNYQTKFKAGDIRIKVDVGSDNSESNFLKGKIGPSIPLNGMLGKLSVSLEFQPYLGTQVEGNASMTFGFEYEGRQDYKVRHSGGAWHDIETLPCEEPQGALLSPWDADVSLSIDGTVKLGLFAAVDMKLFGRDDYKITFAPYFGYKLSGEQVLIDFTDISYEESKDVHLVGGLVAGLDVSAEAHLSKYEVEAELFSAEWIGLISKRWLFPEFSSPSLSIKDDQAECSTMVKRDLLFKSEVGIAQYDADEELVESSEAKPYFLEQDFVANPLEASFSHNEDHTYWTYLKWGEKIIKCEECNSIVQVSSIRLGLDSYELHLIYDDNGRLIKITSNEGDSYSYYYTESSITGTGGGGVYRCSLDEMGRIISCYESYSEGYDKAYYSYDDNGYIASGYENRKAIWEDYNIAQIESRNESVYCSYNNVTNRTNLDLNWFVADAYELDTFTDLLGDDSDVLMVAFPAMGYMGNTNRNFLTEVRENSYGNHHYYRFDWKYDKNGYPISCHMTEDGYDYDFTIFFDYNNYTPDI